MSTPSWRPSETRPLTESEVMAEQEALLKGVRAALRGMAQRASAPSPHRAAGIPTLGPHLA